MKILIPFSSKESELKKQDCVNASQQQMLLLMKCRETESAMRKTDDKLKNIVQQVSMCPKFENKFSHLPKLGENNFSIQPKK